MTTTTAAYFLSHLVRSQSDQCGNRNLSRSRAEGYESRARKFLHGPRTLWTKGTGGRRVRLRLVKAVPPWRSNCAVSLRVLYVDSAAVRLRLTFAALHAPVKLGFMALQVALLSKLLVAHVARVRLAVEMDGIHVHVECVLS